MRAVQTSRVPTQHEITKQQADLVKGNINLYLTLLQDMIETQKKVTEQDDYNLCANHINFMRNELRKLNDVLMSIQRGCNHTHQSRPSNFVCVHCGAKLKK
jgi:hypothetical protein